MKIWFTISGTNHQKVVPLFEKTDQFQPRQNQQQHLRNHLHAEE